jgi:glutathione S-transferase
MKPTNQMELFGSTTSPFVRRLRVLLQDKDFIFNKVTLDKDAERIMQHSPIGKIPFLKDGSTVIWDSRQIYEYLRQKFNIPEMSWQRQNYLTAISELNDALVVIFYFRKEGFKPEDNFFAKKNFDRSLRLLSYLEKECSELAKNWDFAAMSLFCALDWANYREVIKLSDYPNLDRFIATKAADPQLSKTHPSQP